MSRFNAAASRPERREGRLPPERRPDPTLPTPSDAELQSIILHGNTETLVKSAKEMGNALAPILSTSQLRAVFGTVRRIEMRWLKGAAPEANNPYKAELLLLKPRLAYQVGRAKQKAAGERNGIIALEPVLRRAIELVSDRAHFQHFVDYLEAIVAYHKEAGGR
ncbi:MAG: type III-A CRISPR-associated protein Csm2 [Sphingomonadaceae bacterium]